MKRDKAKSASIIICTLDGVRSLEATLESVLHVSIPEGWSVELLVVDNGSTDGTAEAVSRFVSPMFPVHYINEPRRGIANARNRGLAEARGNVLLFLDDDVRLPENWLCAMCAALAAGKDAVCGGMTAPAHLERPWMTARHRGMLACFGRLWADAPPEQVTLISASMAFTRPVLDRVPGFDPELARGSDSFFSWQLKAAGLRMGYVDVTCEHHFDESRLSRASFLGMARQMGRGAAYVARHWDHKKIKAPRLQALFFSGMLALYRVCHPFLAAQREGCSEREIELELKTEFFRRYCVEARRPANYSLHGLVKRAPVPS